MCNSVLSLSEIKDIARSRGATHMQVLDGGYIVALKECPQYGCSHLIFNYDGTVLYEWYFRELTLSDGRDLVIDSAIPVDEFEILDPYVRCNANRIAREHGAIHFRLTSRFLILYQFDDASNTWQSKPISDRDFFDWDECDKPAPENLRTVQPFP